MGCCGVWENRTHLRRMPRMQVMIDVRVVVVVMVMSRSVTVMRSREEMSILESGLQSVGTGRIQSQVVVQGRGVSEYALTSAIMWPS